MNALLTVVATMVVTVLVLGLIWSLVWTGVFDEDMGTKLSELALIGGVLSLAIEACRAWWFREAK